MEEKIILDNFGYEPAEIANAGFARWDVLKDCSQESHNILIMPTWRNWLDSVSDEAFENSAYFRNYMQLLNSERFSEILEKYDLQIYFYLHAKFQSHLKTFHIASDRINVLSFGDTPVNADEMPYADHRLFQCLLGYALPEQTDFVLSV